MTPTTPTQLLEIEAAMTPAPWYQRLKVPDVIVGTDERDLIFLEMGEVSDALGICAARNKLKDLAELWAAVEALMADLPEGESERVLALKVEEILTRLRGD